MKLESPSTQGFADIPEEMVGTRGEGDLVFRYREVFGSD